MSMKECYNPDAAEKTSQRFQLRVVKLHRLSEQFKVCIFVGLVGRMRKLLEMTQQETVVDRLVSIIQSIQLAQGSGVLTVRRGEGATLEEGTIVFVKGQATQTIAGRRTGKTALNWLSTWGSCRYVFASATGATQPLAPVSSAGVERVTPAATEAQPRTPISPLRRLAEPTGRSAVPPTRAGETPLPVNRDLPASLALSATTIPFSTQPLEEALRRIEQGRLSRSHRQLFLLIDGQRAVVELSRLVGKGQEEVSKALRDLERLGVIHLGGD